MYHLSNSRCTDSLLNDISCLVPHDALEKSCKYDVHSWLMSGSQYCRLEQSIPDRHIVVVLLLVSGRKVLLGHHLKANGWMPFGGHLEPNETLRECAIRELSEEAFIYDKTLITDPFFLSCVSTNDQTNSHIDVGFWFAVHIPDSLKNVNHNEEFSYVEWFDFNELPPTPLGYNFFRALQKYKREYIL